MKQLILYACLFFLTFQAGCTHPKNLEYPILQADLKTSVAGTIKARVQKTAEFISTNKNTVTHIVSSEINTPQAANPILSTLEKIPASTKPTSLPPPNPTATEIQVDTPTTTAIRNTSGKDQYIHILSPGKGSQVTSPIELQARIASERGRLLRIELRGQDRRILSRLVRLSNIFPWNTADISIPVIFEINLPKEKGYLSVSLADDVGRTVALNSVGIILHKDGEADILNYLPVPEIIIHNPTQGSTIQGDFLLVDGELVGNIQPPIYVKLITNTGKVLTHRQAEIQHNEEGGNRLYFVRVPFEVTSKTPVLLTVYSSEGNAGEISLLSSLEIFLSP